MSRRGLNGGLHDEHHLSLGEATGRENCCSTGKVIGIFRF